LAVPVQRISSNEAGKKVVCAEHTADANGEQLG
jgi:hypothetical protein